MDVALSILLDNAVLMTLFWTGLVEVDERAESTVTWGMALIAQKEKV